MKPRRSSILIGIFIMLGLLWGDNLALAQETPHSQSTVANPNQGIAPNDPQTQSSKESPPAPITAINIVGNLDTAGETPLPDGAYTLTFTLFGAGNEQAPVWTETQSGVLLSNGNFKVLLGGQNPLSKELVDRASPLLEVSGSLPGENGATFSPRRIPLTVATPPADKLNASSRLNQHGPVIDLPGSDNVANPAGMDKSDSGQSLQSPIFGGWLRLTNDTIYDHHPSIAYDSYHKRYLVVWYACLTTLNCNIYGQFVSADGAKDGGVLTFASSSSSQYVNPIVIYNSNLSDFLVVFENAISSSDIDVLGQIVQSNGTPWGSIINIDTHTAIQDKPSGAFSPTPNHTATAHGYGEYFVVYESEKSVGGGNYNILGVRIDAYGSFVGGTTTIATNLVNSRESPDVAYLPAYDEYEVVYNCMFSSGGGSYDDDIRGVRLSVTLIAGPEQYVAINDFDQLYPTIAAGNPANEYLVAWEDGNNDRTNVDIFGRRLDYNGVPLGSTDGFSIAGSSDNNDCYDPDVASADRWGYLALWQYNYVDIYGRYWLFGQDAPYASQFASDNTPYSQTHPAVACAPNGDCLNAYEDYYYTSGSTTEITARLIKLRRQALPMIVK